MAPGRWLHAITIIYPDAGCQGVSSPALFLLLRCFQEPVDRYSPMSSALGVSWQFSPSLGSTLARCLLAENLAPASPSLHWQLRGDKWRSSFSLFVCPVPPVSLCQSFQKLPEQICQADGGPAFSVSHWQHNLRPTMQHVWTLQCPNGKSMQCHARPRFSEESLSVSTFCWAPSEELCIFYLSLEIRLDPDENIGLCAQTRCLARTHIHSRACKWASFCCRKSRQLWREMGGTVGICICRWEKKLHLPQGPAVEMNQLSMVCRSDPILLITKSQNNKDQKVVGHAVCSSFVVP